MKYYLRTILISVIFHIMIIIIVFISHSKRSLESKYIQFNISSMKTDQTNSERSNQSATTSKNKYKQRSKKPNSPPGSESMINIMKYENFKHKISAAAIDTIQNKIPKLDNYNLTKRSPHKNILNYLKKDHPKLFKSHKNKTHTKKISPSSNYICDKFDAQIFSFLFHENKGTQIDIYKNFNLTDSITAHIMDTKLQNLVKRGFLSRKKISPQLLFTISALFIQIPVEMSKKNKDNPVYEYKPLIIKENLITYLQAKLFRLENLKKSNSTSLKLEQRIKNLEESLLILTKR